ncbi:MAG: glycosyltransferase [Proteobacteria bacterium]|nr:glycosyltransferase [Pseudomonadota bacterium]
MEKPLVSVLIPTYNKGEFIQEAIESVLNQTYQNLELIIVDDCSSDNTLEIVKKFLNDKRVRFYQNEKNLGIGGNWNKTLSYAKGKYIKYLMADDKFEPHLLEKYVEIMEKYPEVSLVTSYRGIFGEREEVIKQPEIGFIDRKRAIELTLKHLNWIGEPTTVMFRKENLWVGTFKTEFRFLLDIDMWIRQLSCGALYVIPEVLSWFRQYSEQTTKLVKKSFDDVFEEYLLFEMVFHSKQRYLIDDIHDAYELKKKRFLKNYKLIPKMIKQGRFDLALKCYKISFKEGIFLPFFLKTCLNFYRFFMEG